MKLDNFSGEVYINDTVTDKSVYLELINGSDELSGIESTSYTVSGANNISETSLPNILSNEGVSTATVITKDLVGNTSTKSYIIQISLEKINAPVLASGMIPIKWDASGNVTVTTVSDSDWYDYENKKWANATTADGSMWVWIPRYEYEIKNPHTNTVGTINVNLLKGKNQVATSGYTIHPAFTFGDEELEGIWVAKFEASGSTSAVDIKPSRTSLRSNTISNIFTSCRNMETNNRYGWGTTGEDIDTHLIKNIEWGSVAYLTQSIYGKNSEVWINPNNKYLTGQAGKTVSSSSSISTYAYNNKQYGINASTTGNEYGIYDMSGSAYEYTAGYINNGSSNLNRYGLNLVNAEAKYKDIYLAGSNQNNTYIANSAKKGDAVYETSSSINGAYSWYSDYAYMPYSSSMFFVRGNVYSSRTSAGIYAFYYSTGASSLAYGFRPSLVVTN